MNLVGLSKEVAEKYRETLSTLTFNNKIVINTLTEIAKEEIKHAAVVTKVIEDRIRKVKADQMLPLMYLMDSICKNIGVPYNELFQQNLVSNFSLVFQAVNQKVMFVLIIKILVEMLVTVNPRKTKEQKSIKKKIFLCFR